MQLNLSLSGMGTGQFSTMMWSEGSHRDRWAEPWKQKEREKGAVAGEREAEA